MSAQLDTLAVPSYRRMVEGDLDSVVAIELEAYAYPWTRGNFTDSLQAGYDCWVMECGGAIAGYAVAAIAAGEAHLLNLCVAVAFQRRGLGSQLLHFVVAYVKALRADKMFLEVRPSNAPARQLYERAGFRQIALRRGYYPGPGDHEDAIVMELPL